MPDAPQLDYAPRPPVHRRRWVIRIVIAAAVVASLAAAGWFVVPELRRRLDLLAAQRPFLDYKHPPGSVLFRQAEADIFDPLPEDIGPMLPFHDPRPVVDPSSMNYVERADFDGPLGDRR